MDFSAYRKIRKTVSGSWIEFRAPIECSCFGVLNAGTKDVQIKTSAGDQDGYSILGAGLQDGVTVPARRDGHDEYARFQIRDLVFLARSADGSPQDVVVSWVR